MPEENPVQQRLGPKLAQKKMRGHPAKYSGAGNSADNSRQVGERRTESPRQGLIAPYQPETQLLYAGYKRHRNEFGNFLQNDKINLSFHFIKSSSNNPRKILSSFKKRCRLH